MKEFRRQVAEEFAFLANEFGFHEERVPLENEFCVSHVNATTRILVEGIHGGGSARVAFGRAAALDTFENCDVLDLASIRCPDKMAAAMTRPENQLSHLKTLAAILRDCGVEVLRGDFSSTHQIRELQEERMREWEREEARRGRPRPPRPNQPA